MALEITEILLPGLSFTGILTAMAACTPEKGKELFEMCGNCHGQNGEGKAQAGLSI